MGTELAKQAGPGLTEAFATTAIASVEATETSAGIESIALILKKKQEQLEPGEQLQDSQIQNVAQTMAALLQVFKKDMRK